MMAQTNTLAVDRGDEKWSDFVRNLKLQVDLLEVKFDKSQVWVAEALGVGKRSIGQFHTC